MIETRKEYQKWKRNPESLTSFVTKRMNIISRNTESAAADWEMIKATNKELPDLHKWSCTCGIDYAKTSDWVSVVLHFKKGEERYDICHSWICSQSKDLERIKAPWKTWVDDGRITYVDDVEISPFIIADYIKRMGAEYNIQMVCIDSYRYALLSSALKNVGFNKDRGNLHMVTQRDICKVVPIIDHCFSCGLFNWGDDPVLRWATNNTKRIHYGRDVGADKGSFVYAKIEARSRKTDPFMAMVSAMVDETEIKEYKPIKGKPILTF
jgi:phage terminase large subunit-like protein